MDWFADLLKELHREGSIMMAAPFLTSILLLLGLAFGWGAAWLVLHQRLQHHKEMLEELRRQLASDRPHAAPDDPAQTNAKKWPVKEMQDVIYGLRENKQGNPDAHLTGIYWVLLRVLGELSDRNIPVPAINDEDTMARKREPLMEYLQKVAAFLYADRIKEAKKTAKAYASKVDRYAS